MAPAAAIYVLIVRLGAAQALVMFGATFGLSKTRSRPGFIGFYIMLRPLLAKQRK